MSSTLPQPPPIQKHRPRHVRFEISSLDQSVRKLNSSHFRWTCPFPIREVTEMTIVGGSIPTPATNIDTGTRSSWNSFSFRIATSKITITIPPGLYTPATLFIKLKELLDAAAALVGSENTFEVGFEAASENLRITRITGTDTYGFLFGTGTASDTLDQMTKVVLQIGSPALLLGFIPGRNELDIDGIIVAPNCLDLGLLTNRTYLYLNYDTTQNLQTFSRGHGRNSPSAIIHYDEVRDGRKFLNKETYIPLIVSKTNPVGRIQSLDVIFQDFFGNEVNFGNREVSLVVEAMCQ